jgi:rod shape determining protein RodA
MSSLTGVERDLTLVEKFGQISWTLLLLICLTTAVGVVALYSAANGSMDPWASRHIIRFSVCLVMMMVIALVDIRLWLRFAYPIYLVCLLMLGAVEIVGKMGGGAQRWISIGPVQLQPSEIMKVAMVLALARFFHSATLEDVGRPTFLLVPLFLVLMPVGLVLMQPNLGTALMMLMIGGAIFFASGVRLWKFGLLIAGGLGAIPVIWRFMHDYQKQRVLTFLDPSTDPLGSGYHITQSKIALGSGGIAGKGFLGGTQSHLNFLPEKHTDFIFTLLAEEWGMIGGLALITLYALIVAYGLLIALQSRHHFGRLIAIGLSVNFFLYLAINNSMVMGLIPVVGIPLPLVSYGGTAMLGVMLGFGYLMCVLIHRDVRISRRVRFD